MRESADGDRMPEGGSALLRDLARDDTPVEKKDAAGVEEGGDEDAADEQGRGLADERDTQQAADGDTTGPRQESEVLRETEGEGARRQARDRARAERRPPSAEARAQHVLAFGRSMRQAAKGAKLRERGQ